MAAEVVAKWKRKDPNDEADYWFDWGSDEQDPEIRFLPPDTIIVNHVVTVLTPGVTNIADSHTDKVVRWRADGGIHDTDYEVECVITTDTGETFQTINTLKVRNRTDVPA